MGRLTTHVLDTANGCPGAGLSIKLYRLENGQWQLLSDCLTNADGRCEQPLLQGDAYRSGLYQLHFAVGDYYRGRGLSLPSPAFLDQVVLQVGIDAGEAHYHVPLLVSPYAYSTYRGS